MSYTIAAAAGAVGALALDLAVLRTRLVLSRVFWVSYVIVFGFQLVFNGILTTREVVRYRPSAILGPRLVGAPIEDLVFGFALVLMTLSLWVFWSRRVDP
jgi:lycopene cyclase domain-containing protein